LDKLCDKEQDELKRMEQAAQKAYPLLRAMRGHAAWETYKQEILGYIALVDKC
jgi:hypothetical protein